MSVTSVLKKFFHAHIDGPLAGYLRADGAIKQDVVVSEIVDVTVGNLPEGTATEAKQNDLISELKLKANLTETQPVSAASLPLPTGAATSENQINATQKSQIVDSAGNIIGSHSNMLYMVGFGHLVSVGLITDHKTWLKLGYNPVVSDVEESICSSGGTYSFSKGEEGLEVVSDDNAQDIGTQLYTGTSDGGSLTTLVDTGEDFTAGSIVAVFDIVILDKSGLVPEWGVVTGVTANTLTVAGGFSSGGTGDARDYIILDYSAHTGAQAVHCKYLDGDYAEHAEIIILNGTTAVPTINVNYFRVNGFRMIAAGSHGVPTGNLSIRDLGDTPIYGYITLGYTVSRCAVFTVPADKTLHINSFNAAWCSPNEIKVQSARVILRANMDKRNGFNTGHIFFPYI